LVALCKQMKKDGLVPIAFGDKDAWPAMGTFDQINFRLNGYDFHKSLMAGKESWTDAKVKAVFDHWAELLPYHQDGAVGRTWQDAAQTLVAKKAGMYLLGSFVAQQFT
ncbi:sugar ABC transporter substrate-binding protein, partial [Streptomyces sp. Ru72]